MASTSGRKLPHSLSAPGGSVTRRVTDSARAVYLYTYLRRTVLVQSDICKETVCSKRFSAFMHLLRRWIAYYKPRSYLRHDELVS